MSDYRPSSRYALAGKLRKAIGEKGRWGGEHATTFQKRYMNSKVNTRQHKCWSLN